MILLDGPGGFVGRKRSQAVVAYGHAFLYAPGMTFSAGFLRCAPWLLAGVLVSGCLRSVQSRQDEEKESHFLLGRSRVGAMDYQGAIEAFTKALEVNPRSAAAHFELACLYENREADPAAGIYHYQQYLKLRPKAENAEFVNQHIYALKQELAKTVSLGPVTERQQREFERLVEDNRRLSAELEKWRASATRVPALTNQPSPAIQPGRSAKSASPAQRPKADAAAPGAANSGMLPVAAAGGTQRTHAVQAGETPTVIARKYGIRVDALMAANPRMDARRLRVGQTLNIPAANL
jgi:LysM repeat protein